MNASLTTWCNKVLFAFHVTSPSSIASAKISVKAANLVQRDIRAGVGKVSKQSAEKDFKKSSLAAREIPHRGTYKNAIRITRAKQKTTRHQMSLPKADA